PAGDAPATRPTTLGPPTTGIGCSPPPPPAAGCNPAPADAVMTTAPAARPSRLPRAPPPPPGRPRPGTRAPAPPSIAPAPPRRARAARAAHRQRGWLPGGGALPGCGGGVAGRTAGALDPPGGRPPPGSTTGGRPPGPAGPPAPGGSDICGASLPFFTSSSSTS